MKVLVFISRVIVAGSLFLTGFLVTFAWIQKQDNSIFGEGILVELFLMAASLGGGVIPLLIALLAFATDE